MEETSHWPARQEGMHVNWFEEHGIDIWPFVNRSHGHMAGSKPVNELLLIFLSGGKGRDSSACVAQRSAVDVRHINQQRSSLADKRDLRRELS